MTHLIIDEVHERTAEIDLLLLWARRMMIYDPDLRIVLMSATFETQELVKYFTDPLFVNPRWNFRVKTIDVRQEPYQREIVWLDDFFNSPRQWVVDLLTCVQSYAS
jgi:HrpA-like RNA helicase